MNELVMTLRYGLRMTAPILLAVLGGLFTQQAGVLNIAMDGMMLIGAFTSVIISMTTGNIYLAIIAAVISGLMLGIVFSYFSISLKGNFIIIGLAINMFATGLTAYLLQTFYNTQGILNSGKIIGLDPINIPILNKIPIINTIFNNHTPLVYFSLVAIVIVHFVLYKTVFGLRLRTVGENPDAAKSLGLNVNKIKYSAVLISGAFSALGGVNLALGNIRSFAEGMTAGRGFIALAAIFCGRGTPIGGSIASFVFGLANGLQMRLQTYNFPGNFVQMIPFVSIIFILTIIGFIKKYNSLQRGDFLG